MGTVLEPQKTVRSQIRGRKSKKNDGRRAAAMAVLLSRYDNPQHPENAATDFSANNLFCFTETQFPVKQKEMTLNSVSSHNR